MLYSCDLHSLEQMLDNVHQGLEWQGVVQVPRTMWRHLGHQQDPDTVIEYVKLVMGGGPAPGASRRRAGGPRGKDGGGAEEETEGRKRMSVGFLLRQSSSVPVEARRVSYGKLAGGAAAGAAAEPSSTSFDSNGGSFTLMGSAGRATATTTTTTTTPGETRHSSITQV